MSPSCTSPAPLVVHVIYRLAVGGLENGLVNLINRMPPERYRHAIVCIDDYTDFRDRIERDDVEVFALHKKPGHDLAVFWRFWRLMRQLRPAIVHTRNISALEFQLPAILAGVPYRVQGEHGRDTSDIGGVNGKYLLLRRLLHPLVSRFIALSKDLGTWLEKQAHVPPIKVSQIYNGVDIDRFCPQENRATFPIPGFVPKDGVVIGTVGRMQGEKDQLTLVKAFIALLDRIDNGRDKLRLVLIGDGPLRRPAEELLQAAGVEELAWLAGNRSDAPQLLQGMDIFALPSLIEGVSNTILEAMATGLPVVATAVGGNPELVVDGETGCLVPSADSEAMADALQYYIQSADVRRQHGRAGRLRVEKEFSMEAMVAGYLGVYDGLLENVASEAKFVSEK
jgi:sugar transferase (PEP-CTERM/EpsH1 system associated)